MRAINIIPKLILILFVLFIADIFFSQTSASAVASCCSSEKGRCTGSAYCTACSNCSRCGYCNNGGSCGVCAGRKTNRRYDSNKPSTNNSNNNDNKSIYNLPDDRYSEYYLNTLIVNSETLNLRKGPSTSYAIIQQLKRNQELVFLAMTDEWIKVKIKSNGVIGFVHYKYVE